MSFGNCWWKNSRREMLIISSNLDHRLPEGIQVWEFYQVNTEHFLWKIHPCKLFFLSDMSYPCLNSALHSSQLWTATYSSPITLWHSYHEDSGAKSIFSCFLSSSCQLPLWYHFLSVCLSVRLLSLPKLSFQVQFMLGIDITFIFVHGDKWHSTAR